jgi:CheY-like chemotaxis protein
MSYILIVDDDLDGREALRRSLAHYGFEVACASNGRQALTSILARLPDVVVLDLFMPEMGGVCLLEILRSYMRLQGLPVIVLTAVPHTRLLSRVRDLNVTSILVKGSTSVQEVLRAIQREVPPNPSSGAGPYSPSPAH